MNLRINEPFYEVHSVSSTKVLNRTCGTRADKDAEDTVRLQIAGGDSSGKIVRGVITMKNSEACGIETVWYHSYSKYVCAPAYLLRNRLITLCIT